MGTTLISRSISALNVASLGTNHVSASGAGEVVGAALGTREAPANSVPAKEKRLQTCGRHITHLAKRLNFTVRDDSWAYLEKKRSGELRFLTT